MNTAKSFNKLGEIIDKFIKDGSLFEVNISSKTKSTVLKIANAENFRKLSMVSARNMDT